MECGNAATGFRVATEACRTRAAHTQSRAKGVNVIRQDTLERCEGYNVLYPGGHLGFVDFVLHDQNGDVTGLAVACGLFARRAVIVPIGEIARVDPSSRRVTLLDTPESGRDEDVARALRSHAHVGVE